jgi:RHS repeat-associated protein
VRTVTAAYAQGLLAAVPGYASSLTYHPNGLVAQVTHTNGVLDLQEKDPNDMARPLRLRTSGASEELDTGVFSYDGAGNITKMGSHRYVYDLLSRIDEAQVEVPGTGCGDELLLQSGTETGTVTRESCGTVRAQGSYGVGATGDVTLRAGKRVVLGDGFSVAAGGRLTVGTDPAFDPEGEPTDASQSYTFDRFGNLLTVTTEREGESPETRTIGTSSTTNRLSVASYDLSGNVTAWAGRDYRYDPFNMLWQTKPTNGNGHTFVYGPGDERLWAIDWTQGSAATSWIETWTLRDLDGRPLRQFRTEGGNAATGNWSFHRDYVYRGDGLLAAHTPEGLHHFHLDHLGSPRIITDSNGTTLAQHLYFPFGEEATNPGQDAEALKFTGHERDELDAGGTTADLDYMHARYFSAQLGRFLSFDPVGGTELNPQTWNRYSYVLGNPLKYIDPDGLAEIDFCATSGSDEEQVRCQGSIEVVDEDPGRDFNPLTGAEGLGNLVSGGTLHRTLGSNLNSMTRLPSSMHGMTFQQGLNFAVASGAGGDCASDPNCLMIAEAATALENPLLQTIQGAQEVGLLFALGGSPAARTLGPGGPVFGRGGRVAGGILNKSDLVRIGFSWEGSATTGRQVFRMGIGSKRLPFHYHIRLWPFR